MIKTERIGARITLETRKALEEICKRENRSMSNLLGMIIADYLQEYDKKEKGVK